MATTESLSQLKEHPTVTGQICCSGAPGELEKVMVRGDDTFKLNGKMMEASAAISMILKIDKLGGGEMKIEYLFYLQTDTTYSVMEEMAKELEISTEDCEVIRELMEGGIAGLTLSPECNRAGVEESLSQIDPLSEKIQNVPAKQAPKPEGQETGKGQIKVHNSRRCNRKLGTGLMRLLIPCGYNF